MVAELGAAYLCAEAGISNAVIENQAAYVAGWLKKLRDDRKLLIHAAAQAQRAADYILEPRHEYQRRPRDARAPLVALWTNERQGYLLFKAMFQDIRGSYKKPEKE